MKHLAASTTRNLRFSQSRIGMLFFLGLLVPLWCSSGLISSEVRNTAGRAIKQKVLTGARLLRKPEHYYATEQLQLSPHPRVQDHILHPHQNPVSLWRPRNQFSSAPVALSDQQTPVFALGSIVLNPSRDLINLSYQTLAQSSLKLWHWFVLVDEATSEPESFAILEELAKLDARVKIHRKPSRKSAGYSKTLRKLMLKSGAPYGAFINPPAMLEHTILEKSAWAFASVPMWDIVGHYEGGDILMGGVHFGAANLLDNTIPDATAFRLSSLEATGCTFGDREGRVVLWEMWLCLASHGHWGGTIGEVGSWPPSVPDNDTVSDGNPSKFPTLDAGSWPDIHVPPHAALEPMTWEPPFHNPLPHPIGKSIMIIQGWLLVGGSEMGMLEILRHFAERGYRVTMVLTRFRYPEGMALFSQVSQYTNDIHTLPAFLRMSDFPRYIKYLIDSRGIESVLMSNCQLIYEILPSMVEQTPGVAWIDYLHNESFDGWKTDGFPSFALINQRYLSRTLTCSNYLRDWLIARGYPEQRVGVAKLGINISRFDPTLEEERQNIQDTVFKLPKTTLALVSSARLDTQKRPLLVPDILAEVNRRLAEETAKGSSCDSSEAVMYMMGDGGLKDALKERIRITGMEKHVHLLGTVDKPETVLRGSDAFLLPSATEGISLAVAEAMAMNVPIITSFAGGLPEELGDLGEGTAVAGRLITLTGNLTEEVHGYADAVMELACNKAVRQTLGVAAREQVVQTFDQDMTLQAFPSEFEIAKRTRPYDEHKLDVPNPAAYSGLQTMATEDPIFAQLAHTQKQLSRVKLTGKAGELQDRCFLDSPAGERWKAAVLNETMCDKDTSHNEWLFKSAKEQCGAWCLFDLHSLKADVWKFNGKCFTYHAHDAPGARGCASWFEHRPLISFV